MDGNDVLKYVMDNPGNTNYNVLAPMIEEISGITPTGKINITENGTDIDVAQYAKADVAVNPNYTQTITGTAAAPFGDVDFDTLKTAIYGSNASAYLVADATALEAGTIRGYVTADVNVMYMDGALLTIDSSRAYSIVWTSTGLDEFFMEINGTVADVSSYASAVPTTLTIYWHPIPEA